MHCTLRSYTSKSVIWKIKMSLSLRIKYNPKHGTVFPAILFFLFHFFLCSFHRHTAFQNCKCLTINNSWDFITWLCQLNYLWDYCHSLSFFSHFLLYFSNTLEKRSKWRPHAFKPFWTPPPQLSIISGFCGESGIQKINRLLLNAFFLLYQADSQRLASSS